MKKIKTLVIVIPLVFVSLLLSIVIINFYIDNNRYKPFIIKILESNTGSSVHLNGNVKLKILPKLSLFIEKFEIVNPSGFQGNMAEAESFNLSISILPLLKGTISIDKLTMDGLKVNLIKGLHNNNWDKLLAIYYSSHLPKFIDLSVKTINLNNMIIRYKEANNEKHYITKNLTLQLSALHNDGKIKFKKEKTILKKAILNLNNKLYIAIDLFLDNSKEIIYKGRITTNRFSLNQTLKDLNFELPKKVYKEPFQQVILKSNFYGKKNNLDIRKLNISIGDTNIKGDMKIVSNDLAHIINHRLYIDKFDIANFTYIRGFKLKNESTALVGHMNISFKKFLNILEGKENINISKITLYGLDVNKFSIEVNKAIKGIGFFKKLITRIEAWEALKYIRKSVKKIEDEKEKNYNDKSYLGSFNTSLIIKNNILKTKGFKLKGPSLKIWSSGGVINLEAQKVNYTINARIISPKEQTVINYIYFPYNIQGNISDPQGNIEWNFILKELIKFYSIPEKDRTSLKPFGIM